MQSYHDKATTMYGNMCEWIGCGWHVGWCDVHHIGYKEQQAMEKLIREAYDKQDIPMYMALCSDAKKRGWGSYNVKDRNLQKDDKLYNLAVLCPNHHRYVHTVDLGINLLQFIPPRQMEEVTPPKGD